MGPRMIFPTPSFACQKLNQLDLDAQCLLHDVCCLWIWLRAKLVLSFSGEVIQKHDELTVHEWVAWWPSSVADSICISVFCRVWGFRGDWRGDRPKIFG